MSRRNFKRTKISPRIAAGTMLHSLACLSLCWSHAVAQQVNSCSTAYHAALGEIRAAKGDDLAGAVAAMRATDPMLPGFWLYPAAAYSKQPRRTRPILAERPCLEQAKVSGRMRCVRYGAPTEPAEPPLPTDLTITPAPTAEEMKIIKGISDLVEGRGAIPDVGPNGRQTWLATRATSDLKTYITQPPHVALCSGGKEVTEFYANSLRPLQKRADDVAGLSRRAHLLAAERVATAVATATAPVALSSAEPQAVATASPKASPTASVTDIVKLPLVAMVAEAVRGVLTTDDVDTIRAETSALAALRRAKPMLIQAQADAAKADDKAQRERVLAAGRAMRMIEAAAYTDVYAERYAKFAASVIELPGQIRAAHDKACTCGM